MSDEVTAYKYSIPLQDEDGVETPAYDPPTGDHVISVRYEADRVIAVTAESVPHYHRDSVTVSVEEVDLADYADDVSEYVDDSEEDEGGET